MFTFLGICQNCEIFRWITNVRILEQRGSKKNENGSASYGSTVVSFAISTVASTVRERVGREVATSRQRPDPGSCKVFGVIPVIFSDAGEPHATTRMPVCVCVCGLRVAKERAPGGGAGNSDQEEFGRRNCTVLGRRAMARHSVEHDAGDVFCVASHEKEMG